jgi:hypothetical protein
MIFLSYYFHKISHVEQGIGNLVHSYHHDNDNRFSQFIEIVMEYLTIQLPIVFKYYNVPLFSFMNEWIVMFYAFVYVTVHNINYSIFHVNRVHEYHHKDVTKNIGPDICDILFGTKHDVENSIENTDHYIPNIILATGIVLFIQGLWRTTEDKSFYISLFSTIMVILTAIYLIASIYIGVQSPFLRGGCALRGRSRGSASPFVRPPRCEATKSPLTLSPPTRAGLNAE